MRPLSDQAKEGLFNIIVNEVPGSYFLDLFAGSGQVGIEALSRGAELAFFVEIDRKAVSVIRDNLQATGLSERSEVYNFDALRAVKFLDKKKAAFDIIFIGAPYTVPVLAPALENIAKSDIVKEGGMVIAEHHKRQDLPGAYGPLVKAREARYGDTVFSFYRREK